MRTLFKMKGAGCQFHGTFITESEKTVAL